MSAEVEERVAESKATTLGTVIAVCYSEELINNIGKEPKGSAQITKWGIRGDRHYGETRISHGKVVPNNRPITVVGAEAGRAACERLGVDPIPPGGLGENLLLEGLGDLSELEPGDEMHILSPDGATTQVVLSVVKQNEPCSNTMVYHKQMVKELYGRRGVICEVLQEGHVKVGDRARLVR